MADTEVINAEASSQTAAVVGMVLLCSLLANYLQRFNTSYWIASDSILAIVVGFVASFPFCSYGEFSGGTRRPGKQFDTIFFLYLVPPILFESGYSLNHKDFFKNFTAIVLFATVGTVVSAIVIGMSLFALAQRGFITSLDAESPKEALLFGALLSATDPVATLAVLGQLRVEPQLYSIIFGESVLNDAVAIVLFQVRGLSRCMYSIRARQF
jgi:sodium/hydrogen exchanger 8